MIVFAVFRNDQIVCRAGAENLGVLSSIMTWCAQDAAECPNSEGLDLTIGGLVSSGPGKGTHLEWARLDLRRGDEIRIQILDSETADEPIEKRTPEEGSEILLASKKDYVRRMCSELGWSISEGDT